MLVREEFVPGPMVIIRGRRTVRATALDAIRSGGVDSIEVTLGTPGCFELVATCAAVQETSIGVGSVRSVADARSAVDAGARFLVTPTTVPEVIEFARESGVPIVCGALTPTEIDLAWRLGASAVKIFPIGSVGGPEYLRAIQAPLREIPFIPTGGVDVHSTRDYAELGCAGVGLGSSVFSDESFDGVEGPAVLADRARRHAEAWREGHAKAGDSQ